MKSNIICICRISVKSGKFLPFVSELHTKDMYSIDDTCTVTHAYNNLTHKDNSKYTLLEYAQMFLVQYQLWFFSKKLSRNTVMNIRGPGFNSLKESMFQLIALFLILDMQCILCRYINMNDRSD